MMSRERLIEVLASVNVCVHGTDATTLHYASDFLRSGIRPCPYLILARLVIFRDHHPSPHIRELAGEALHYLKEDGK